MVSDQQIGWRESLGNEAGGGVDSLVQACHTSSFHPLTKTLEEALGIRLVVKSRDPLV